MKTTRSNQIAAIRDVKSMCRFADCYGMEIMRDALLEACFFTVSYREKTVPGEGSPTRKTAQLLCDGIEIERAIFHIKNPSITLFTNKGVLRFWRDMIAVREKLRNQTKAEGADQ